MASTRLTNAIKNALTGQLIDHAFAKRCKDLILDELAFSQQVYDHIMGTNKVQFNGRNVSVGSVVDVLPAGWDNKVDCIKVQFGGETTRLDKYHGLSHQWPPNSDLIGVEAVNVRNRVKWSFPPCWNANGTVVAFSANDAVSKRFVKLQGRRADLVSEITSASNSARVTMDSVSTVQKLIILWPEVESFAKEFLTEKKAAAVLLPVVARDHLNETLGLPVVA